MWNYGQHKQCVETQLLHQLITRIEVRTVTGRLAPVILSATQPAETALENVR